VSVPLSSASATRVGRDAGHEHDACSLLSVARTWSLHRALTQQAQMVVQVSQFRISSRELA